MKTHDVTHLSIPPLPLTNEGHLSLFFLGCGTAFSKTLYQNNVILIKGESSVFVDFGTRAPFALFQLGRNSSHVTTLAITHSHADHVGGLEELALTGRYFLKRKPIIITPEVYFPYLWKETLQGGCRYSELMPDGDFMKPNDLFDVKFPVKLTLAGNGPGAPVATTGVTLKEERLFYEIDVNGINLVFFQTKHIPSNSDIMSDHHYSFGLVIDKRILFSSDTKFDPELIDFLTGIYPIEHIYHDTQLFTGGVHASYDQLKTLPPKLKAMTYLMHYGDNYHQIDPCADGFIDFVQQWSYYNYY